VDVYPEPDKLGKQFKYASARSVKLVTVAGADERARGEITVKDMVSGEQLSLPRADAAVGVSRLLPRSGHDGHKEHKGH
jgi:histidyl-tRNA synthetase